MVQKVNFSNLRGDTLTVGNTTITGTGVTVGGESLGGGGGVTVYANTDILPYVGNSPGDQAFVNSNNRLYIWNGSGWYNVALLNIAPTIQSVVDANGNTTPFELSTSGANTVITITATDSDGDPITYSANTDSGFNGLATISQSNNVFTIIPKNANNATTESGTVTFKVTDGINISSSINVFTLLFALDGGVVFTDAFMTTLSSSTGDETAPGDDAVTVRTQPTPAYPTVAPLGSIGDFPSNMGNHRFFDESIDRHTKGFTIHQNPFSISGFQNGSLEFWIRYNNNYSARQFVMGDKYMLGEGVAYGITWLRDGLTDVGIYYDGVSSSNKYTGAFTVGTWYHVYFAKINANTHFYVDGSKEYTWSGHAADQSDVVDKLQFMNNTSADDGAAVSIAGIRFNKGDLIYATSGAGDSTITGVEEPV